MCLQGGLIGGGFKYQPQHLVSDIPASAFEPAAAFRCKPEVGSETNPPKLRI